MSNDLSKRVALVTGASRGLGASIARNLGAAGAAVAVNYFGNPVGAKSVVEDIRKAGGKAEAFRADVREEQQIRQMVSEIEKLFGPIDILVPNATGPQPFIKIEEMTWRACLDQLDFFVKSPLLLVQAVIGSMKKKRYGRIINFSSTGAKVGTPALISYNASKSAVLAITRGLASQYGPDGITVNTVLPGIIGTTMWDTINADVGPMVGFAPGEMMADRVRRIPLGRAGAPEEVASVVAFLASDDAAYVTGQALNVCGGLLMS